MDILWLDRNSSTPPSDEQSDVTAKSFCEKVNKKHNVCKETVFLLPINFHHGHHGESLDFFEMIPFLQPRLRVSGSFLAPSCFQPRRRSLETHRHSGCFNQQSSRRHHIQFTNNNDKPSSVNSLRPNVNTETAYFRKVDSRAGQTNTNRKTMGAAGSTAAHSLCKAE